MSKSSIFNVIHSNHREFYVLSFCRSALVSNSTNDNSSYLTLLSEERMSIQSHMSLSSLQVVHDDVIQVFNETFQYDKKYPKSYIDSNWPIRAYSISHNGLFIAIAGRTGLAHFNIASRKWKVFSNKQEEESFYVVGSLVWFKYLIIASCFNCISESFEVQKLCTSI